MIIEHSGRRMGKTTKAVKLANETGAYLIVPNKHQAQQVSKEHKLDRYPITIHEFLADKMKGSFVRNVVIDNADMVLEQIFNGLKIEGITLTDGF